VIEERIRGRNPKEHKKLITHAFKEGKVYFCRAIMRKVVKLIKYDAKIAQDLIALLGEETYTII
jgi:hypothetical protein